jgi:small-conductance mechanosensitive channel
MAPQDGGMEQTGAETEPATMQEDPAPGRTAASSVLGVRLREVTVFIDWLQAAVNALKTGGSLPETPALDPGEVLEWMQTLQKLEERAQQGGETCVTLRRELSAKEEHLLRLAHDLESANDHVKELQAACEELKLDVERQRATVSRLVEIEQERDKLTAQIKDMTSELVKRTGDLDRLAAEWKRVSEERQGSRKRT